MRPIVPQGVGRPKTGATGHNLGADSLRGPLIAAGQDRRIEQLLINVPLDPYLSLKALATYSGLSVRKLRDCLTHSSHPLPHYRVDGKILVRRSEFDTWIAAYRRVGDTDVDQIVDDILGGLA
jgi:Helix-turn-helix domain